jgi:hypothetical protein
MLPDHNAMNVHAVLNIEDAVCAHVILADFSK